jgi:hypothetical protein
MNTSTMSLERYPVLDRYLDLAVKHWGSPRTINFVVMHGMNSAMTPPTPPEVNLLDEEAGQTLRLPVGGDSLPADKKREYWRAFATSLYNHIKSRGLEKSMYWGYPLEVEADPELKTILAEYTPDVYWTAGPHEMMSR